MLYLFWIPVDLTFLWLLMSIRLLKPDEVAAIYSLGRRWKVVGLGGLHFIPFLVSKAYVFSTSTQRVMIPGEKEDIVRHDDDPLAPGQVRAMRIIHATMDNATYYIRSGDKYEPKEYSALEDKERARFAMKNDSLSSSISVEVIAYAEWNVNYGQGLEGDKKSECDKCVFNFVENIGSITRAKKRIRQTVQSALQARLGHVTARHAVEIKDHIETLIKVELSRMVGEEIPGELVTAEKPWGVNITEVRIEDFNPGQRIDAARADEAAAISLRKKKIQEAEADRLAAVEAAKGEAFRERTLGRAKAKAFEQMAEILETPGGQFAAQQETARAVLASARTIVVPNDPGGVISSLATVVSNVTKSASSHTAP